MLRRLSLNPARLQLAASLAFNVIAKAPGLVAAFVILPLVSRSLGTSAYGEMLSALALGAVFTLPYGGINAVGRRLLASAFGAGDKSRQANVFVTSTTLNALVMLLAALILSAGAAHSWSRPVFLVIALLPVIGGFLNVFDNTRASFNEHYVTAVLQLIVQILIYGGVYLIGLSPGAIVAAGLTLQSPYALASILTMIALLLKRPYLLRGRIEGVSAMLLPAVGVMMADGSLGLLLNLSVYWLTLAGQSPMSAWLGTFTRLFSSFMSPVLLIFFPLTTYISMRWGTVSIQRRLLLHRLFILTGFGYGAIVGVAMAFLGPLYIERMFRLSLHGDRLDVLALSLFLGAIIAQKTYTMLLYAVAEARFVSYGTALAAATAIAAAAVSAVWLPPMRTIDVLFVTVGIAVPAILLIGDHRYRRALAESAAPR